MKAIKVILSAHTDKFAQGSLDLAFDKGVNFIFGKNGTGKSTIANEIEKQFSEDYDVHIFRDFDGVVENERLNAVALGAENAEIQKDIKKIDEAILEIDKQISLPEIGRDNLFSRALKSEKDFKTQEKKIEEFYKTAAQQIKNIRNPNIAPPTYNKNTFLHDISNASILTDEAMATHRETMRSDKKPDIKPVLFPDIDLEVYLSTTNEILKTKVKQPQAISDLHNNSEKQDFARHGMRIHERKTGELCSFCGNEIDEERWVTLGNYFNNEVKILESRIANGIMKLNQELAVIATILQFDNNEFHGKYRGDINNLNVNIELKKKEYAEVLRELAGALEAKSKKLFAETDELSLKLPGDFTAIRQASDKIIGSNNELSKNLTGEQNKAQDALRLHEVRKRLDSFNFESENTKLDLLCRLNSEGQSTLKLKQQEKIVKQGERASLILKTKDEEKIARKINDLLNASSMISFSLKHIIDGDEGQKGQYQILGHDGLTIRPITDLSRGEKNIIAFLYFMLCLTQPDKANKPRLIVLDDPMTSNDDTMQYLMISEIQKYYRTVKDDDLFVALTHNTHFYLNVRDNTKKTYGMDDDGKEITFYKKYGVFHLISDGKHTSILSIVNGKQDFGTSYETLWKELMFLYDAADATPDIMLGPCRRICETYMHFTKVDGSVFYRNSPEAKKLFDVNQHAIDDHEAEQNGKTKSEIKGALQELFKQNNADSHFKSYWKNN